VLGHAGGERISVGEKKFLRDLFRRTWEMELLLSGAVLFVLFRIPPVVDQAYLRWDAIASNANFMAGFFLWYYGKLILYSLIGAFTLHLVVRAVWVGFLGLASVFPRGVNWEEMKQGPYVKAEMRRRFPSMRVLIRRADALASVLFALSFSIVGIFVWSIIALALISLLAWPISVLTGWERDPIFWTLFIVGNLVLAVPALLDRFLGDRLDPDGALVGYVRKSARWSWYAAAQPLYVPVWATVGTNIKSRAFAIASPMYIVLLLTAFLVADMFVPEGLVRADGGSFFPDEAEAGLMLPEFYEDQPAMERMRNDLPSIPTDVVRAPVVRVFLPYRPRRQDELMEERCNGAVSLRPDGFRFRPRSTRPTDAGEVEATARCFGELYRVSLDGEPVSFENAQFARRSPFDQPGIALFVDLRSSRPGFHELRIEQLDYTLTEEEAEDREADARQPDAEGRVWEVYTIPFWN
jgi:hypothetical protein